MGPRELLLIVIGGGLIAFFTKERVLRALFTLFIVWAVTLTSASLYRPAAERLEMVFPDQTLIQGWLFIIFLILFSVIGYVMLHKAFPDTQLPKLGILDNVLGLIFGVVIAAIVVSLILNAVGVMVQEQWAGDRQGWANSRASYQNSILRPWTGQVIGIYQLTFFIFFNPMPSVLTPQ